jgi:hypothetical protein
LPNGRFICLHQRRIKLRYPKNGRFCCCITGQIYLLAPDIRPARGDFVGPLASVYGKDEGGADAAVWPDASRDEQLPPLRLHSEQAWLAGLPPVQATMAALRQPGVPDEVIQTKEGLAVYPAGLGAEE